MSLRRAALRRLLLLHTRRPFLTTARGEVRKASIFRDIDELKAETRRMIIKDVDKVKRMESEDRNALNRLLTSYGMPRGAFRDKLVFGCNVAAAFVASSAVGACGAAWKRGTT
uniref:Uncharacterized protein n=1 Tax=Leersia perrieri TaxID=77586 RepID=A0A0D9WUT3_9ORYZ